MFAPAKRATLLYPSGDTHHLFIALTDPHGPAQMVLLVPVCTIVSDANDRTCLLHAGDHAFVIRPSYISYRHLRQERADALVNGVSRGAFVDRGMLAEPVFAKVLAACAPRPFTPRFATALFGRGSGGSAEASQELMRTRSGGLLEAMRLGFAEPDVSKPYTL